MLIMYQALRTVIADTALASTGIAPDRLSLTIAVSTARDSIPTAALTLAQDGIDLIGRIGTALLSAVMPARRSRSSPRVTKRAISKHRAKGTIDRTNHTTTVTTHLLPILDSTAEP